MPIYFVLQFIDTFPSIAFVVAVIIISFFIFGTIDFKNNNINIAKGIIIVIFSAVIFIATSIIPALFFEIQ